MEKEEIALIAFSQRGYELGQRLVKKLREREEGEISLWVKCSHLGEISYGKSVGEWTREHFDRARALVFIGACQIGVRSIGPLLQGKEKDPAVLVVDETGRFVIPILSGHLGGANALALFLSESLGATPVITTATDLHGMFAVDDFARTHGYALPDLKAAKEVSAALLSGERVGFYSELPLKGETPRGLVLCDKEGLPLKGQEEGEGDIPGFLGDMSGFLGERPRVGIFLSCKRYSKGQPPFSVTCPLVPPLLTLGMGCKRGIPLERVRSLAEEALSGYWRQGLFALATIDVKREEQALIGLAKELGVPLVTYSALELSKVEGSRAYSAFVEKTVGVGNVCERAALLAAGEGKLLKEKLAGEGATCALARREGRLIFD